LTDQFMTKRSKLVHTLSLRSWPAVRTVSLDLTVSNRCSAIFSAAFKSEVLLTVNVKTASEVHQLRIIINIFQCIVQPNTTLLDCIM